MEQLSELGLSRRRVHRLVASGEIVHWSSTTYRVLPSTGWLDDVKAALTAIPGSVASHHAAAALHGFPRLRTPAAMITVHSRTTHEVPDVRVVRSHDISPDHTCDVDGIKATTVARTVFDLCALLHPRHIGAIAEDLMLEKKLTHADLAEILDATARRGKPGVKTMRTILDRLGPGYVPKTELERRGFAIVERAAVPAPQVECPIPWDTRRRFDLAWPDARIAIEWDSRRWHGALEQMTFDRRRDREAIQNGWVVLRFTWDDVTVRPHEIARELRSVLQSRSRVS